MMMTYRKFLRSAPFFLLVLLVQLIGCTPGSSYTSVQGNVALDGQHIQDEKNRASSPDALKTSAEQDLGRLFLVTEGEASYYADRFHGRLTANGERFDMHEMTAAHKTLPFGSLVRVTNLDNGKEVVVRINDRGPFIKGRAIDLSLGAAKEIGMIRKGVTNVRMEVYDGNTGDESGNS